MRRFLTLSFIVLALVTSTTAGLIPVAHAEDNSDGYADGQTCKKNEECASGTCYGADSGQDENGDLQITSGTCMSKEDADAAADAAAKKAAEKNDIDIIDKALAWIMVKIMSLFAWLVGVAALVLNYAVYYTVVTMGDYVSKLSAVGVTWSILRDIGNIMLIFGFLAVGISVILNSEWYGGGAKMLPMLLVAAVFINFSLFITEAVIDTSNLFATQFYKQINEGKMPDASDTSIKNEAISNTIMTKIGINGIYNSAKEGEKGLGTGNTFLIGFMSIILFSVTAFVMFTLAFILIARFVILLFLIIIAPIGFAGLAIPQLKGTAGKWWNTLFEQAITAPVLMLLLYIALSVIIDDNFLKFGEKADWTGFTGVGADIANFAGMMLSFIIAMGLLLAVVIISKKLSAFGAGAASKTAGKLSFGAISLGGRATLGSAGNLLASKRMQSWARKGGVGGLALKTAVLAGKGLRSSTYDFRNAPGVAAGLGAIDINAGKGATLTAKQVHDAQYGLKPIKAWSQKSKEEREQAGKEIDFKRAQKEQRKINERYGTGPLTPAQEAARAAELEPHEQIITSTLSRMSTKQLEELGGIKEGVEALVRNLSPEQFEGLMKSDKFSDIDKENMRENRYRSLNTAITASITAPVGSPAARAARDAVRQWSAKDLVTAAPGILNNPAQAASFVSLMSDGQLDAVVKNDKLSKSQQSQLRSFSTESKIGNFLDVVNGRPLRTPALTVAGVIPVGMTPIAANAEATRMIGTMTPKKLAKLHGSILTDPIAMSLFTPKHLAAFMTDGDLDSAEISTIAAAVRNPAHPNHVAIMSYLNPATNPIAANYWL